jgi:hypothetical protein
VYAIGKAIYPDVAHGVAGEDGALWDKMMWRKVWAPVDGKAVSCQLQGEAVDEKLMA